VSGPGEGRQLLVQWRVGEPVGEGRHRVGADAEYDLQRVLPRIFEDLRAEWAGALGSRRLRELTADLRTVTPADGFRMDVAGWFGS
jgi:hypothetical protein